ncbi:putative holin [Methylobacter sp.]|uniref:putative holin n=1 Tax=Methylobacter sp. TaxID=2051955 RepID=UPI002487C75E|nr:putative holin [Methylobacter sp.]MDI1279278.1 putative holin [Methylobacter sp.]
MRLPRLFVWSLLSLFLLGVIALLYPQQVGVLAFKLLLVAMAGVGGYWLDRALFPYARPDGYLAHGLSYRYNPPQGDPDNADCEVNDGYHKVFAAAMLRRAIIVGSAMLAIGLGA